jgi:hypothetical protein
MPVQYRWGILVGRPICKHGVECSKEFVVEGVPPHATFKLLAKGGAALRSELERRCSRGPTATAHSGVTIRVRDRTHHHCRNFWSSRIGGNIVVKESPCFLLLELCNLVKTLKQDGCSASVYDTDGGRSHKGDIINPQTLYL